MEFKVGDRVIGNTKVMSVVCGRKGVITEVLLTKYKVKFDDGLSCEVFPHFLTIQKTEGADWKECRK